MYHFTIDLIPVPWASHKGYGRRAYNPREPDRLEAQHFLKIQTRPKIIETAVKVHFVFHMPIPKSTSKKMRAEMLAGKVHHVRRPDATNLQKFMEDVIKGILIVDDSQVVCISSEKIWGEHGMTEIYFEELK